MAVGAAGPLRSQDTPRRGGFAHGSNGLGGAELPAPKVRWQCTACSLSGGASACSTNHQMPEHLPRCCWRDKLALGCQLTVVAYCWRRLASHTPPQYPLTAMQAVPVAASAAQLIVERVRSAPGQVALLGLGPLTNIAQALALDPGIAALWVRGCYVHILLALTPHLTLTLHPDPGSTIIAIPLLRLWTKRPLI